VMADLIRLIGQILCERLSLQMTLDRAGTPVYLKWSVNGRVSDAVSVIKTRLSELERATDECNTLLEAIKQSPTMKPKKYYKRIASITLSYKLYNLTP